MSQAKETPGRGRGRPRKFERGPSLDATMRVFWRYGYEATGVAALREAMGNMPSASFYSLFESKEKLFEEAVAHYRSTYGRVLDPLADASLRPRAAIEETLRGSIRMQTDPEHPLGCMMVLSAASMDPSDPVFQIVSQRRSRTRTRLRERVQEAIAADELPAETQSDAMVGLIYGFLMGISTLARDGMTPHQLQHSVDALLAPWVPAAASTADPVSS